MRLTDDEQAMLDGKQGPARQKAMELLVKYGEALGAEKLVDTNNVCAGMVGATPFVQEFAAKAGGIDAVFSEFNLDSREAVTIPPVKAYTCSVAPGMDPAHWKMQGVRPEMHELNMRNEWFWDRIGIQAMYTCAPYLLGNVPIKGQHCAWMESSAVVLCNSAFGGRTNTEGCESTGAAMLTGKIPYWGYHLDENRLGTHLVDVEFDVQSVMDWGLLGYYVGEILQEQIPVFKGVRQNPDLPRLKHCGAAAASSGGVEMYHIVGVTPEAHSLDQAFGKSKPKATLKFGNPERRKAYDKLNSAKDSNVDFVVLGCPHYTTEQIWQACKLLEGKHVDYNTNLWIFTPKGIKDIADRNGYTEIISSAGAFLMTDTCPCLGRVSPLGVKVAATDSAKQAHYLPAIMGFQTWFGSLEDCIQAAISGKWEGDLK
jgi:predicted aconitase